MLSAGRHVRVFFEGTLCGLGLKGNSTDKDTPTCKQNQITVPSRRHELHKYSDASHVDCKHQPACGACVVVEGTPLSRSVCEAVFDQEK